MKLFFFSIVLIFVSLSVIANTNQTSITLAPLDIWQEQKFVGETSYTLIEDEGVTAIRAKSDGTASMLLQETSIDLTKTPFINWQWKIDGTINKENEQAKAGDDYPARIYIAVPNSFLSLYPRALNYVWASESPQNTHWKNPYTDDVIMLAAQSGEQNVGQWVSEKRNLSEDLQKVFGKDFDKIKGIAIMTDTDNLNASATAFYKNIYFSEE